jgi:hypothetical protein
MESFFAVKCVERASFAARHSLSLKLWKLLSKDVEAYVLCILYFMSLCYEEDEWNRFLLSVKSV